MSPNVIPVLIVGPESWESFKILNPNAFAANLRFYVRACADKLALIRYSMRIIRKEIDRDVEGFVKQLSHGASFKDFVPNPKKLPLAIYHNMTFQAGLQSFFITTKSMLDMYARIVAKAIMPKSNFFGFKKALFQGKKIPGGALLNFLERSVPRTYANRDKLIGILCNHIDSWISDVVRLRDEVVHEGQPNDLIEMCVLLSKNPQEITREEIILPTIHGKGTILEYCQVVQESIYRMLRETLGLLPSVDTELLDL